MDSTIVTEIAPLRAMWAEIGQQAPVPISGSHDRRILSGVLNVHSGEYLQYTSRQFTQVQFQHMLHLIHAHWRGWHIVLFIDRNSAHTAKACRRLARVLGIELRWLPRACSHLNPVDHLWRDLKKTVLPNEPTPDLDSTLKRAEEYLASLSRRERLRKAGALSGDFWLADLWE